MARAWEASVLHTKGPSEVTARSRHVNDLCVRFYQPTHVVLVHNPFRQPLLIAGQRRLGGGIGGKVAHPLAEPEKALNRRQ